jgi:2,3-bisphosphoglycerate-independent phosphoglycerate mutase
LVLYLITDGRDSDRKSFIETLENFVEVNRSFFSTISDKLYVGSFGGRSFSMDRDNNFDKVARGLEAIFGYDIRDNRQALESKFGSLEYFKDPSEHYTEKLPLLDSIDKLKSFFLANYNKGVYDEFLEPTSFGSIGEAEVLWLVNFRADRMRQVVSLIVSLNCSKFKGLRLLAMNDFGSHSDQEYEYVFKSTPNPNNLATQIANTNKTQLHIAETEKFNHVTFFLNGGQSKKQMGEEWVMIPSNKLANHSDQPEMKAKEITDFLLENLHNYDYVIVNYANPDMVGHCGNIEKGIESMEFLDAQLARLLSKVEQEGHTLFITADHGNMEFVGAFLKDGKDLTDTEHNANPVPFVIIHSSLKNLDNSKLKSLNQRFDDAGLKGIDFSIRERTTDGLWLDKIEDPSGALWYTGAGLLVDITNI